jgi:hypothetical protein
MRICKILKIRGRDLKRDIPRRSGQRRVKALNVAYDHVNTLVLKVPR